MKRTKIIVSIVIVIMWCQVGATVGVEEAEAKVRNSEIGEVKEDVETRREGGETKGRGMIGREGKEAERIRLEKLKRWGEMKNRRRGELQ